MRCAAAVVIAASLYRETRVEYISDAARRSSFKTWRALQGGRRVPGRPGSVDAFGVPRHGHAREARAGVGGYRQAAVRRHEDLAAPIDRHVPQVGVAQASGGALEGERATAVARDPEPARRREVEARPGHGDAAACAGARLDDGERRAADRFLQVAARARPHRRAAGVDALRRRRCGARGGTCERAVDEARAPVGRDPEPAEGGGVDVAG